MTPAAGGSWTQTLLHSFTSTDGNYPYGGLFRDSSGNLYGTTEQGGANKLGAVFELAPPAGGGWTETLLHSFDGTDGQYPAAGLVLDSKGNLYGTTQVGGASSEGTVFVIKN